MITAASLTGPNRPGRPRLGRATYFAAVAAVIGIATTTSPALGASFTVDNTNDGIADVGSLRWAIDQANTQPGRDTIAFDVPGPGPHVIAPTTDLPTVVGRVTIDGYTQPGSAPATVGAPADLRIVIDATAATRALELATNNSTVRGLVLQNTAAAGIGSHGIRLVGRGNAIMGNYIGTDETGTQAAGNLGDGVRINGDANRVGGPMPEEGNLISGNNLDGVRLESGSGNTIQGNLIGPDATGGVDLEVDQVGVHVEGGSSANVIGGAGDGEGNVISGGDDGVRLDSDLNVVRGNMIGTNGAGDAALPNSGSGITVKGSGNRVGGPDAGEGNLVSGNESNGVSITPLFNGAPADGNRVEGNTIGTDNTGTNALPNGAQGVVVSDASANVIGGAAPGAGNLIAGNGGHGVDIHQLQAPSPPRDNVVRGNKIGTDTTGMNPLGNEGAGVHVDGVLNTTIGDGGANTIAYNALDGVTVTRATGTAILGNSIHSNGDLAIDLADDGVTRNDPPVNLDADLGANQLQNFPRVTSASTVEGARVAGVSWTLDSLPMTSFRIELYQNDVCRREGRAFVGSTVAVTDAVGHADGVDLVKVSPAGGLGITATATPLVARSESVPLPLPVTEDPNPDLLVPDGTSEFSPCTEVTVFGNPFPGLSGRDRPHASVYPTFAVMAGSG